MFDTVFGLPVHVLTVHGAVVALPSLAVAAVAVAAYRPWRRRLTFALAAVAFGVSVLAWVAVESGQAFNARLGMPAAALEHSELGETMHWFALALTGALLLLGVLARRQRVAQVKVAVGVVLVFVTAGLLIWRTVLVGHSGSAAVWGDIVESTQAPTG